MFKLIHKIKVKLDKIERDKINERKISGPENWEHPER